MSLTNNDYITRYRAMIGRANFAYYTQRATQAEGGCGSSIGIAAFSPSNDASVVASMRIGARNTTPAEYDTYVAAGACSAPAGDLLRSKGTTTAGEFVVGAEPEKDMDNADFTDELTPSNYQSTLFPGMADLIDENIVAGDKAAEDRLLASYWNDLGNDIFDDWGYFYLYDVASSKYYFPLLTPQNEDDGVITTQTFSAFGRTFTITHGWAVQGIFKLDITVADALPFRFGAYGDMGSDGDEFTEALTHSYTISGAPLTLHYHRDQEEGDDDEQLYTYFVPKVVAEAVEQPYDVYYDSDNMSMISAAVTRGLLVYFAKSNDTKDWVAADLEIAGAGPV